MAAESSTPQWAPSRGNQPPLDEAPEEDFLSEAGRDPQGQQRQQERGSLRPGLSDHRVDLGQGAGLAKLQ